VAHTALLLFCSRAPFWQQISGRACDAAASCFIKLILHNAPWMQTHDAIYLSAGWTDLLRRLSAEISNEARSMFCSRRWPCRHLLNLTAASFISRLLDFSRSTYKFWFFQNLGKKKRFCYEAKFLLKNCPFIGRFIWYLELVENHLRDNYLVSVYNYILKQQVVCFIAVIGAKIIL
jgi:hypothetical protein